MAHRSLQHVSIAGHSAISWTIVGQVDSICDVRQITLIVSRSTAQFHRVGSSVTADTLVDALITVILSMLTTFTHHICVTAVRCSQTLALTFAIIDFDYTLGDSHVILFHICASWFCRHLVGKTRETFITVIVLKYLLLASWWSYSNNAINLPHFNSTLYRAIPTRWRTYRDRRLCDVTLPCDVGYSRPTPLCLALCSRASVFSSSVSMRK